MKNILIAAWNWLVKSSKDPNKVSLTVKGAISTGIIALGYFGITGNEIDAVAIGENTAEIMAQAAAAITAIITIYGAGRKIYLSLKKFFAN